MVAKTPPKQKKMEAAATLNPVLVRETLNKVEMCMSRLQELQFTVTGGNKVISGVSLSPRSTRGYLRTSLRCKQESVRIKNGGGRKSPVGKFPANEGGGGEWQRMSLPAMLVDETIGEILQASKFAREMVEAVTNNTTKNTTMDDPKTPLTRQRNRRPNLEDSELRARRKREKQEKFQSKRTESHSPSLQRVRSRINFKVVSPPTKRDVVDKENAQYLANRVSSSPWNRPWSKKAVLFPNALFLPSDNSQPPKFCRTKSPVITRNRQQTPHKFLIKSPASASKFQVKIKSPPVVITRSPTRPLVSLSKQQSPKKPATSSKLRRSFSPSRLTASKLRQSFSPSRLAARLVSPLKSRKSVHKHGGQINLSGLKQRPTTQMRI
ncbi:microtubule-binding protein TANGLED [Momordica charantia]|uniref:Microtubule-binding protein TANGLED n=1 Tax=Momordica charantia TaxID=3673 RepID=A0A6J1DBP0_MOMCH|nr:microtubule-binding protein TANGLED [Momordica charantia]